MDLADGYRVQQELVALLTADGDRVTGYKLGLTSAPMQALMGVDSPDFAPVLASHLRPDGATVTAGSFIAGPALPGGVRPARRRRADLPVTERSQADAVYPGHHGEGAHR